MKMQETDWEEIRDFSFVALQLLDKATLYSKKEVLKEYEKHKNDENIEELLLDKSIYPNSEKLNFYNISKYTLNDILNKKEIEDAEWYTLKEKFALERDEIFYKSMGIDFYKEMKMEFGDIEREVIFYKEMEIEFGDYLRENHPLEYSEYENFMKKLKKEFNGYFNGFSTNVQTFFRIIPNIDDDLFYETYICLISDNPSNRIEDIDLIVSNKENFTSYIKNYIKNEFRLEEKYINYEELENFLTNTLFEDGEFEEKISILQILPESPLIFSCLDYITNINNECIVDIYIISNRIFTIFLLGFVEIINKNVGDFSYDFYDEGKFYEGKFYVFDGEFFESFFDKEKQFDYIIENSYSSFDDTLLLIDPLSYDVQVSSRMMSVGEKIRDGFHDCWLKNDLLESLILIPFKNPIERIVVGREVYKPIEYGIFNLALVTTLNFNKSEKQKNKFLVVDKNQNYDVTSLNHTVEDYKNIIKSNEIYYGSYKLFSEFIDSNSSKIFNIDSFLNTIKYSLFGFFSFSDYNEEMYDVKMKSQAKYFDIEYFEEGNRIVKKLNYPIEKLGKLLVEDDSLDKMNNNLYMADNARYDDDKIVFFNFEIGNESHYYCLTPNIEKVSLQYLYYYLNSEMGKKEYFYHKRRRLGTISNIRVPIPPKEAQDKIVEAMNRSDELFDGMKQLKTTINKNFFNYEGNLNAVDEFFGKDEYDKETQELSIANKWEYAHSGLIWPLAITYLLATSGSFEKVEKANNLIKLFEFTVAFNSYVLISGIPDEIYEKNKTKIWEYAYDKRNNDEKYAKRLNLSFGSWDYFHGILKGIYKKEFRTEISKEFYMNLLDKKIRNHYTNLKNERNNEFHGGISNPYEAETLLNELNAPKLEIFNHLNSCYEKLRLYYTTGRADMKTKEWEIIFLNGPYSMPIYSTITSEEILEPESLYLHDRIENKFTKLNDNLIKFKAVDEMKHDWRLYIFIGFETDKNGNKKAKYRCYQRKEEDLLEDINLNELM